MILNRLSKIHLLLVVLVLGFAVTWPLIKIGLAYMPPLWFSADRLIMGAITMLIIAGLTHNLHWPKRQDMPMILVIAVFQIAIALALMVAGLNYVAVGRSAILIYTTPLWVTPVAVFFGEKLNALKVVGLLLGLGGIVLLFNPAAFDWADKSTIIGNGMLLLAAISWSVAILYARFAKWYSTPLQLIFWQLFISAILLVIFALVWEPHPAIQWTPALWGSLLFNGLFATAFGYWGLVTVSKELPAIVNSLSMLSVPVLTLILSALILNEPLTPTIIASILIIIAGLACVVLANKPIKKA